MGCVMLVRFFVYPYSAGTARVLLALGAILLAIEGTWSVPIHTTYAFAAYLVVLMLTLLVTVLSALKKRAKLGFILNHLGILLIISASFFGSPHVRRCKVILYEGEVSQLAYTDDNHLLTLPFPIALQDFEVEYYEQDGHSPRQFTSQLLVDGVPMTTAVNAPCSHEGWTIYQHSYDQWEGAYSILLLVRDPWLPLVYLGMMMLAMGSVMLLFGKWRAKVTIPITLLLTVGATAFSVMKINFQTLMPALRSWWFVPHLFLYMVAYSLMAFALVMWFVEHYKKGGVAAESWMKNMSDNLVRSSSALLIIGMLTGSVWARQAWGDYWAWDPKENWAAVTWLLSLMHLHLQHKRGWKAIAILMLTFLALQITWYGVNYLPSAAESLHTYMKG